MLVRWINSNCFFSLEANLKKKKKRNHREKMKSMHKNSKYSHTNVHPTKMLAIVE